MLEAIVLGIVQGITEFLPISSTAHLVVLPWFFKWGGGLNTLTFDIALHAGTFFALVVSFRKDLIEMAGENRRLILPIIVGTLPAAFAGLIFHDYIEGGLRSPYVIVLMLAVFGLVMIASERGKKETDMKSVTARDAFFIGLAQAAALVPGVSRSGATIAAGLFLGLKRPEAARFSFLLSMPAVAGSMALEGGKLFGGHYDYDLALFAVGFISSLITGIMTITFLLKYLRRHRLHAFAYYRFLLSALVLGWLLLRG